MKRIMPIIFIFLSLGVSAHAGWFDHEAEQKEKERRQYAEKQLAREQQTNAALQFTIHLL